VSDLRVYTVTVSAVALVAVFLIGSAIAVPVGRVLEWKTGISTVVFDGGVHAKKGFKCSDCHPNPFMMKKDYAKMKMVEIIAGKYCGVCHNGQKAFPSNKAEDCARCHKKM
jgi:c(7)-type cytochrome triheme protein